MSGIVTVVVVVVCVTFSVFDTAATRMLYTYVFTYICMPMHLLWLCHEKVRAYKRNKVKGIKQQEDENKTITKHTNEYQNTQKQIKSTAINLKGE